MNRRYFVEVVVPETDGKFHYHLLSSSETGPLEEGVRLLVPFGRGWRVGYFIRKVEQPQVQETKGVLSILDEASLIPPPLFKLLLWISDYYFAPLGGVIKGALPKGIDVIIRRRYRLTELGRTTGDGKKTLLEERVIELFSREGLFTEQQLQKRLGGKGLTRLLSRLKQKGWLEEEWQAGPPSIRKRLRQIILLKKTPEEGEPLIESLQKQAPQQAKVIKTLLSAGGVLPLTAFETSLRPPLKRLLQKKWIRQIEESSPRLPKREAGFRIKGPMVLSQIQQRAADEIISSLQKRTFSPFLLHGVTGSGKTEVYLRVVERSLQQKRGAILLVPEIALTAQLVARFHNRFGEAVALLHSGLSAGERYDEWRRIKEGKALLAIGVRSAIFAPFSDLGVIIVDEEHDPSYKQEEGIHYHARDMALVRGKEANSVVVLGSATPSFESFYNGQIGKYRHLHLPGRIDARPLPSVHVVDLREKEKWVRPFLTQPLLSAIEQRLASHEQVLLFINRRGFSTSLLCTDCGQIPRCIRCAVSLTYHQILRKLVCHYCGFQTAPPTACPDCQGVRLTYLGIGTEQVEEAIRALFPGVRLARMDRDTTQKKEAHQKILAAMEQGEIDILIGTQMIAKGHDFPNITLVGVLCADLSLHFPDFRASERTFQLLIQVAGRAGRGERLGEVIIQTFQPGHDSILAATTHDDLGFYARELAFRKEVGYPPFSRLTLLSLSHRQVERVAEEADRLASILKKALPGTGVDLLGPAPAPITRLRGKYRYQILLKAREQKKIASVLREGMEGWKKSDRKGIKLEVNVDPQNFV